MLLQEIFGSSTEFVIKKIDEYSPIKRKRDYDTKYCLYHICRVLKQNIAWKFLETKAHYTTIYKRFLVWKRDRVFERIWEDINTKYCLQELQNDKQWADVLIIDSTMIKNEAGIDMTGYNHFDRNRQATKQSIICDKNGVPLSCSFYPANVHDSKTIENSINQLSKLIRLNDTFHNHLVADSAYIINEKARKDILYKSKVNLIAQPRKNMKQLSHKETSLMKKHRFKIEHLFRKLDYFRRLRSRWDRCFTNYETFNYMAMMSLTIKRLR